MPLQRRCKYDQARFYERDVLRDELQELMEKDEESSTRWKRAVQDLLVRNIGAKTIKSFHIVFYLIYHSTVYFVLSLLQKFRVLLYFVNSN